MIVDAVGRITHDLGASGTAYVVGERTALTAFHTIRDAGSNLRIVFDDGRSVAAASVWHDEALDVAVLELVEPHPAVEPIPLVIGRPAINDCWSTLGYPEQDSIVTSVSAFGTVTRVTGGQLRGDPTIELFCQQTANRLPAVGFSGGPVLVRRADGSAAGSIGVISAGIKSADPTRELERIGGVIFASPISVLVERFPELAGRPGVEIVDLGSVLSGWRAKLDGLDPDQLRLLHRLAHVPPPGLSIDRLARLVERDRRSVEAGVGALSATGHILGVNGMRWTVQVGLAEHLRHAGKPSPQARLVELAEEIAAPLDEIAYLFGGTTWTGIRVPATVSFTTDLAAADWFSANAEDARAIVSALMDSGDVDRGWPLARAVVVASLPGLQPDVRSELERILVRVTSQVNDVHEQHVAALLGAQLALRIGDADEADQRLEQVAVALEHHGDAHGGALVSTMRALVRIGLGRWAQVEDMLGGAVEIFESVDDPRGLAQAVLVEAQLAAARGQPDASAHFARAHELFERAGCRRLYADSLAMLGQALAMSGQTSGQDVIAAQLTSISGAGADRSGSARALAGSGSLTAMGGDVDRAQKMLERSLAEWRHLGDRRGEASALLHLAHIQSAGGWFAKSVESAQEAVDLSRTVGTPIERSQALLTLGQGLIGLAELDRAEAVAAEARHLAFDDPTTTNAEMLTGDLDLARGRPGAAVGSFASALDRARRAGTVHARLILLMKLGLAHAGHGDRAASEQCHDEALALARASMHAVGEFNVLLQRTDYFVSFDLHAHARAEAGEAFEVACRLDDLRSQAVALIAKAAALQGLGRFKEALGEVGIARAIFEGLDDSPGCAMCRATVGQVTQAMGDLRGALVAFEDAVAIWLGAGDDRGVAAAQLLLAIAQQGAGMLSLAGETFESVRATNKRLGNSINEAWALYGRALTQAESGDVAAAAGTLRVARRGLRGSLHPSAHVLFVHFEAVMDRALGRARRAVATDAGIVDTVERIDDREQRVAAWVALCRAATGTGDVALTQVGRHALAELGAPAAMTDQVSRSVGHAAAVAERLLMATVTFHEVLEPLESPASIDRLQSYVVAAFAACRAGRFDLGRTWQLAIEEAAAGTDCVTAMRDAASLDSQISMFVCDPHRVESARQRCRSLHEQMGHDVGLSSFALDEAVMRAANDAGARPVSGSGLVARFRSAFTMLAPSMPSMPSPDVAAVAAARDVAQSTGDATLAAAAESVAQILAAVGGTATMPDLGPVLDALSPIDSPQRRADALLAVAERWFGARQPHAAHAAASAAAEEYERGGANRLCLLGRLKAARMLYRVDIAAALVHLDAMWAQAVSFDDPALLASVGVTRVAAATFQGSGAAGSVDDVVSSIDALPEAADRAATRLELVQSRGYWRTKPEVLRAQAKVCIAEADDLDWIAGRGWVFHALAEMGDQRAMSGSQQARTQLMDAVRSIG